MEVSGVGAGQDEVEGGAVVAIDDPAIAFDGLGEARSQDIGLDHRPVGVPVEGIEFDVGEG